MAKYFTLLERDNDTTPWAIAFGDYDRDAVADEAQEYCEDGYHTSNLKIISTNEAQTSINAKVKELNSEVTP